MRVAKSLFFVWDHITGKKFPVKQICNFSGKTNISNFSSMIEPILSTYLWKSVFWVDKFPRNGSRSIRDKIVPKWSPWGSPRLRENFNNINRDWLSMYVRFQPIVCIPAVSRIPIAWMFASSNTWSTVSKATSKSIILWRRLLVMFIDHINFHTKSASAVSVERWVR